MKFRKTISAIFFSLCLVGCSTNESINEVDVSHSILEETSTGDIYSVTPTAVSETTYTIESSEVTETTEHNPIHIMHQIELGEMIPDGEYFAGILEFDDDCSGGTFVVNGYYALQWEEVEGFEDGDTIIWGDQERTISEITTDSGKTIFDFDDFYFLQKQSNGYYYLRGDCDEIPFYRIADNYHMEFDPNIVIYDYVYILDLYNISTESSYSIEDILKNSYQYDSLEHLRSDMEIVRNQNYHYLSGEEYWVGIHIIVEDGCVTKMFLNPAQHQNWIPYDLLSELRPVEE